MVGSWIVGVRVHVYIHCISALDGPLLLRRSEELESQISKAVSQQIDPSIYAIRIPELFINNQSTFHARASFLSSHSLPLSFLTPSIRATRTY